MMKTKYSITFISRGLLVHESVQLAQLYLKLHDWQKLRQQTLASNLLQTKTMPTAKNLCTEIISRLKTLTENELSFLTSTNTEEQRYLLWLAACKRYPFLFDFAIEVVQEKYFRLDFDLTYQDFDHFFNTKAEWHDELSRLNAEQAKKLRRTVFQILRESHLITTSNKIQTVLVSSELLSTVSEHSKRFLRVYPFSDSEMRTLVR